MSGKRGRPKKVVPLFQDGSLANSRGKRPLSALAQGLANAAAEQDVELRKRWKFGPYVGSDLIYDLEFGDLYPAPVYQDARKRYDEGLQMRSRLGRDGGARNRARPV
jgi:hypothetical protein